MDSDGLEYVPGSDPDSESDSSCRLAEVGKLFQILQFSFKCFGGLSFIVSLHALFNMVYSRGPGSILGSGPPGTAIQKGIFPPHFINLFQISIL